MVLHAGGSNGERPSGSHQAQRINIGTLNASQTLIAQIKQLEDEAVKFVDPRAALDEVEEAALPPAQEGDKRATPAFEVSQLIPGAVVLDMTRSLRTSRHHREPKPSRREKRFP